MGCMSFLLNPKCSLYILDTCLFLDAIDPHYSQILYLQTYLVRKIYLWPQNQYSWLFHSKSQTCTEKWKIGVAWCTISSWGKQDDGLPCSFRSHTIHKYPFYSPFRAMFFTLSCFFGWFCCWKWPPRVGSRCFPVSLSREGCEVTYRENICVK